MGGSPARGALDPNGESFEVRNLFVADASVFPTAVGRNPMVTIMAVSHMIAQRVKARLKSQSSNKPLPISPQKEKARAK